MEIFDKLHEIFFGKIGRQLKLIQQDQTQIKEILMGLKEDFESFKATIGQGLDTITTELAEIQADIERIKIASEQTPPEVLQAMEDLKARVANLATSASQISDIDNPPPADEPENPVEPEEPL